MENETFPYSEFTKDFIKTLQKGIIHNILFSLDKVIPKLHLLS